MTLPVQHQSVDRITIDAWQGQLAEAARDPWLASEIVHRGDEIVPRFAYFYHKLSTLPRRIRRALQRKGSLTFAGLALMLALGNGPAQAATIPVDGTTCTLADAITAANTDTATGGCLAGSGADTVELEAGSVHTLTSELPAIDSEVTIEGQGATIERDPAAPDFGILTVCCSDFTLNDTTITGGVGVYAGGLYITRGGRVTIAHSTISGNTGFYAGGVFEYHGGATTITYSTIVDNIAAGDYGRDAGGVGTNNGLTITHSTVTGNSGGVGAISNARAYDYCGDPTIVIDSSTISGNTSAGVSTKGTVFYYCNPSLFITNSTISGNAGTGVVTGYTTAHLEISRSVISGNAGLDVSADPGPFNCPEPCISVNNYNVFGYDGDARVAGFTPGPTDIVPAAGVQVSDILDPTLADNGGPTLTHALVTGSPAIDAIPGIDPGCLGTDQRGVARPQGNGCDIGAFELESSDPQPALSGCVTFQSRFVEGVTAILKQPNEPAQKATLDAAGCFVFQSGAPGKERFSVLLLFPRHHVEPFAYVPNALDDTVSVLDTANNQEIAIVGVGNYPKGVAIHPNGTVVYVTNVEGTVSVIDTATNLVTSTVFLGDQPWRVAVHPEGTFAYVTNNLGNTVSVIDTTTNSVVETIMVAGSPHSVAVHPEGTFAYVTNNLDNTVSVIDTTTNTVMHTVPVGRRPKGVAIHPSGLFLYVVNEGDATVSVIKTTTHTLLTTVPVPGQAVDVAIHPAGRFVYVTSVAGGPSTVSVIDTTTHTVTDTITVGSGGYGLTVHPDGRFVYVANIFDNTVSVIDTTTNAVVATVGVGVEPKGVAVASIPAVVTGCLRLTGTPAEGATAVLRQRAEPVQEVTLDDTGCFTFPTPLVPGKLVNVILRDEHFPDTTARLR